MRGVRLSCGDKCESCEAVVVRTYRELRRRRRDDRSAFRAALRVLSLRHPERSPEECVILASAWLAKALER